MKLPLPRKVKNYLWNLRAQIFFSFRWLKGLIWPPIVVFTMGKVGSTTVMYSLEKSGLPNPVFHTHFISRDHINKTFELIKSWGMGPKMPLGMRQGVGLQRLGQLTWDKKRWKIITMVREPVAREISDLFQNPHHFPHLLKLDGAAFISGAIAELQEILSTFDPQTNYTVCWFDWEIKEVFGIDVYTQPFDPAKGFAIYSTQRADILMIRLEDLSRCAPQAFQEFLGISIFKLLKANEATAKDYSAEYRQVVNTISFSPDDLDQVYNSRYSRHFYTETEIQTFKKRWSRAFMEPNK